LLAATTTGGRAIQTPCDTAAMPIYVYRCPNGHEFEVFQSMSEDPVTRCQECGAPVERVFQPIAVHFKGSGFYTTDYAKSGSKAKTASDGGSGDSGTSSSDKKSDSSSKSESSKSDSKGSGGKTKAASSD
jgi:putative FmdB family regulatory protein